MNKKYKNITPINDKGQPHGLWERYWGTGKLWYKCFSHNGRKVGYEEWYDWIYGHKITKKKYYL